MELATKLIQAVTYIKEKTPFTPKIGIILGSGLGDFADTLKNSVILEYQNIPHFPISTVKGHQGQFVITDKIICMQGRFHFYEGYCMQQVTFAVRVMKQLGVEKLIVTNAAGGVKENFSSGDLMLIRDHINFMGTNPLIGPNLDEIGPRFPDMSHAYSNDLRQIAQKAAKKIGVSFKEGVYAAFTGPSYETPAEVRMAEILGADAVGMSTVPEVIVANHCGIEVLGISCITNLAAGVSKTPLSHQEVTQTASRVKPKFIALLQEIIRQLSEK